jgi:hypothetical protein
MNRHSVAITTIAALTLLSMGCATVKRTFNGEDFRVDKVWWDSRTDAIHPKQLNEMQIDLATFCAGEVVAWSVEDISFHTAAGTISTAKVRVPTCDDSGTAYEMARRSAVARNSLQDILLRVADNECEKHRGAVVGTNAGTNLLLSTLASLTSGAATGFAAKTTKTALSGISTFFIATRSHVNEQIYHQIFVGTVLKAIDDDRRAVYTEIKNRQRLPVPADWTTTLELPRRYRRRHSSSRFFENTPELTTTPTQNTAGAGDSTKTLPSGVSEQSYSVEQAVKDAGEYHTRCSFYNGLVRVALTVEQASPCRQVIERREQVLSELAAMSASGASSTVYKEKFAAYQAELTALSAKLTGCIQGSTKP